MNEHIKWFVLENLTSTQVVGRYQSLEKLLSQQKKIIEKDPDYIKLAQALDLVRDVGDYSEIEHKLEDAKEEFYSDFYLYGLDENENEVPIDFS